jgi:predicted transcriptional regulator of viral defense system
MKKPLKFGPLTENISKFSKPLGGVFSYADLVNLLAIQDPRRARRILLRLREEGLILKIKRGLYTTRQPDLWTVALRLQPKSYISMDNVLAEALLIGTIPGTISAVQLGSRKKIYNTPVGIFRFYSATSRLFFGFQKRKNGIQVADKEKAYLDMLYFYLRGARFVANPYQDVDIKKLDKQKIKQYLRAYKNPKFVTHVQGILNENTR